MTHDYRSFFRVLIAVAALGFALPTPAQTAPDAADTPPIAEGDRENAAKRMQFMLDALGKYEISYGDPPRLAALHSTALLRWTNPISRAVKDGTLAIYTRNGRPDVVVEFQIHKETYTAHEFSPVAYDGLTMRRGERVVWQPQSGWFEFKPLPDAPAPANSAAGRLVQMRRLAERFTVFDEFGWREEQITRQQLRLLRQPVHRYGGTREITDGALFVFAQGTNPEACLLLEAIDGGWQYGILPTTIYQLDAYLGEQPNAELVWTKPRRLVFGSLNGPYHVGPYQPDADDISLMGLMPSEE